eukprot:s503_g11.t1
MLAFNSAAVACKKNLDWQGALSVLFEMEQEAVLPDLVLYNTIMGCCSKSNRWRQAVALLQQIGNYALQPSTVSCSTAIAACRSNHNEAIIKYLLTSNRPQALRIFDSMECHAVRPNLVCFSAATSACEKGHDWPKALKILQRMAHERCPPDVVHFNSVISVLEKSKLWSLALWVLFMMTDQKVTPDTITHNAGISACGSRWQHSLALLAVFRLGGFEPDAVTFTAAMSSLEKGRRWQSSISLFAEMPRRAIARNAIAFTSAMISGWQQSLLLLKEMRQQSWQPTQVTFGALASTASRDGNWLLVLELLTEMERVQVQANIIYYNSFLKAFGSNWEAAMALLDDLPRRRVEADAVSYWSTMDLLEEAGSIMDCAKHSMLVLLLQNFTRKSTPFIYVDTHAGHGLYDLHSTTARKYQNFLHGIHILERSTIRAAPIAQYLSQMKMFNSGLTRFYLGSPALATRFIRPRDRAILFEASGQVYGALQQSLRRLKVKDEVRTVHMNSYLWLQDHLVTEVLDGRLGGPGLVLMDPPYEPYNEYLTWNLYTIHMLQEVWPESCIAMWQAILSGTRETLLVPPELCKESDLHKFAAGRVMQDISRFSRQEQLNRMLIGLCFGSELQTCMKSVAFRASVLIIAMFYIDIVKMFLPYMVSSTSVGSVPETRLNRRLPLDRASATARVQRVQRVQGLQIKQSAAAFCAACAFASVRNGDQRIALRQSAQTNIDDRDLRFETLKAQQEKVRQRVAEKKARRDQENDLPPPWRMVAHPSEPGQWYYYNEDTGETSWERPGSSPWRQVEDPSTGQFYYYNQATGETSWEAPKELQQELQENAEEKNAVIDETQDLLQDAIQDPVLPQEDLQEASREAGTTASSSSRKGAATRLMAGVSILDVPEEPLTDSEIEIAKKPVDEAALRKDAEDSQERLKILSEEAARRREVMKVRRQVMKGLREKTSGGLTKDDLMVNKHGKIVSKKQHERGLKMFSRYLSTWVDAVQSARSKLSILGFRPIGGRSKEGKELYMEAKKIYDNQNRTESNS